MPLETSTEALHLEKGNNDRFRHLCSDRVRSYDTGLKSLDFRRIYVGFRVVQGSGIWIQGSDIGFPI